MGAGCCDSKAFGEPCGGCAFDQPGKPDMSGELSAGLDGGAEVPAAHAHRLAWAASTAAAKPGLSRFWNVASLQDTYFRGDDRERRQPTSMISELVGGTLDSDQLPGTSELEESEREPQTDERSPGEDEPPWLPTVTFDDSTSKNTCCCQLVKVEWNWYRLHWNIGRLVLLITVNWVPAKHFSRCTYSWKERTTKSYDAPPAGDPVPEGASRVTVPAGPDGTLTPWWVDLSALAHRLTYVPADKGKTWFKRVEQAQEGQCNELLQRGPESYLTIDNPAVSKADVPRTLQIMIALASGSTCGGNAVTFKIKQTVSEISRRGQKIEPAPKRNNRGDPVSQTIPSGNPQEWKDPPTPSGWSDTPHNSEAEYRAAKEREAKEKAAKKKAGG